MADDDSPPTAVGILILVVVLTVMSVVIAKCKSCCRKWEHEDNIPTVSAGTVRQTIVATIPTRSNNQRSAPTIPNPPASYNRTETPFSSDTNLVYGFQNERSDPFQGYDFSSRTGVINQSVRDHVISIDPAPRYVSPRAPEITPEPVHLPVFKPNDNDGLPTYEQVVGVNHQLR